jgi:hypothetical protein
MSDNTTEIEAFLAEVAEKTPERTATAYPSRDRLKAEFDVLYNGYIVESFKDGIEGEYGESTVVNMIDTTNEGRRTALWLSNFEQSHFAQFLEASATNGDILPLQVSFLRHKVVGKNGRQYNKLSMRLDASGDDVLIPAVPADQLNEE